MTCKINASTTGAGGLLIESDSSGALDLQSNGVTKVSFDASGNMTTSGTVPSSALTGSLPALDGSSLTSLSAPNLTGALPALNGSSLTNLPAANITGTLPAIDGSNLTGISTPITKSQIVYYSTSPTNSGSSYVTTFQDFRHPSGGVISGTFNKLSASTTLIAHIHYACRETGGNIHTFGMWADAGNTTALFQATHLDPYHQSQNQVNHSFIARWTGLSAGNHTINAAAGRGDGTNHTYQINFNENSFDSLGINTPAYSMIYVMEIE